MHVLPLLALWVVPVVGLAVLLPLSATQETATLHDAAFTQTTVGERENDLRTSALASVTYGVAPEIRAAGAGTVTAVIARVGVTPENGAELYAVDDRVVVAYKSESPFWRDLEVGSAGDDVRRLSRFLIDRGFLAADQVSSEFGPIILSGVKRFQRAIHAEPDGIFRVSYVAFVPSDMTAIDSVAIRVGDTVAQGDVMLVGTPAADSVKLSPESGDQSFSKFETMPLRFEVGESSVPVASLIPTAEETIDILQLIDDGLASGALSSTVSDQQATTSEVVVSGAGVSLQTPQRQGIVPNSALYVAEGGSVCLYELTDSTRRTVRPVPLAATSAVRGELGSTGVDPRFVGMRVLADTSTISDADARRCN